VDWVDEHSDHVFVAESTNPYLFELTDSSLEVAAVLATTSFTAEGGTAVIMNMAAVLASPSSNDQSMSYAYIEQAVT